MRKLIIVSSIIAIIFLYVMYYHNAIWQEGSPVIVAQGIARLYRNHSTVEQFSVHPQKYIALRNNAHANFIAMMEDKGWRFHEQLGSSVVFVKGPEYITVASRNYCSKFTVFLLPDTSDKSESISLVAFGDILMHNTVIASGTDNGSFNYEHLFAPVKKLIQAGDYASINLESAMAGPETGYTGYPVFNSPDSVADALRKSGFDLVITANNHILDRGAKGALRTLQVLKKAGLDTTGAFASEAESRQYLIRDINGIKAAYLAYTYDTNGIPVPKDKPYLVNLVDKAKILADIKAVRPQVDIVVLVLHWGVEYSPYPTEQQQKLAREFFIQGADVILGSHPHVIQPMETMLINGRKKFVIYSMGNSVGNQHGDERNSGVIFKLQFTKDFTSGETYLSKVDYTPTFCHSYYVNDRQMFRVVPIAATIKAIREGREPYLQADSIPLLERVLDDINKRLNHTLVVE